MDVVVSGNFGQFWLGHALYRVWPSAAVPLLKHCLSKANHIQVVICTRKNPFVSDKPLNTCYFPWYQCLTPVWWPCSALDRPLNFRVLPTLPKFQLLPGHRLSHVLHIFTTSAAYGCPRAKILSSSNFFAASNAVQIFPSVLPRL